MSRPDNDWDKEEQTIVTFTAAPKPTPQPEDADIEHDTPVPRPAMDPFASRYDNDRTVAPKSPGSQEDGDQTVVGASAGRPAIGDELAWVVITRTPSVRRGQMFRITTEVTDIGRSADVAVSLNDMNVGRRHAAIRLETDNESVHFMIYDLASANGTHVNGDRVLAPRALKDGDRITIGATELVFKRV